jgi:glutamate dehydrogenase
MAAPPDASPSGGVLFCKYRSPSNRLSLAGEISVRESLMSLAAAPSLRTAQAIEAAFLARCGGKAGPAERSFIAQAAADWGEDGFPGWTADDLAALAFDLWAWAKGAAGDGPHIRILKAPGPEPVDLIEIVQKDAPFLVSSVMGEVSAHEADVRALIHPVVEDGGRKRSFIQVAIAPLVDARPLVEALGHTLDDVHTAVDDFPAMTKAMTAAIDELEASGKASEEEVAFLRWVDGGRFVFQGLRVYDYPKDGPVGADWRPAESLGVLRDPHRQVLRQGNEPSILAAIARRRLTEHPPVTVAKANLRSRVHRRVHMDYIGIERFDAKGKPVGEMRVVGLFTAEAYNLPVDQTPLIRAKTRSVFERADLPRGGHSEARFRNILAGWPRDDLFQISEDELFEGAMQALRLQDRPQVDLFVRRDPFDRFASILVYVPRERYDFEFVNRAGRLLADAYGGRVSAAYPEFNDAPLARVHFIIGFDPGDRMDADVGRLRRELADLARTWMDKFAEVAMARLEGEALERALYLGKGAPAGYRALNSASDALADVEVIEVLGEAHPLGVRMFRRRGDPKERARFKLYAERLDPVLAEVVPILENMGLKSLREDGFAFSAVHPRTHVDEYLVEAREGGAIDLEAIAPVFEDAMAAVWTGRTENDGFNRLVLELGVGWREAALIRALAKYRQQSGLDPSQAVQEEALADNPQIARLILSMFQVRFDPVLDLPIEERQARSETIWREIETALQDVAAIDADRALRRLALLVRASVRTNFYQHGENHAAKPYISFKVASRELADLPAPRPFREIFVSGPNVDGVHLRFGPVARGGIRWSDRRDDFRTEVLGLVKAQQVKNSVIVPVGSKGGFFPKLLPKGGPPETVREEGVRAYKTFLCGLLDITDNLGPDGAVIHPADTVIHDGDDPYLVVAADKGTATFSDIANGLAGDYGFWLHDAFASGGSAGYDHKAMGITARGAWEAVKRHFRELGKDIQHQPFTCIGIGDMAGDVFGNGMLLSKQTRLMAAFNHRDIFIDPEPDPARSYGERERLFKNPKLTWQDYDRKLISEGGGVFSRSAKSIALSPQIKAALEIEADELTPPELMRAILLAPVELFYLGGIGTYVKAQGQTNVDVGDKANDAIRINGAELRCKVVGEGANLGFTQAGRIEYALAGGRINTDAIDNSAGVDSSDHEVNIKILTGVIEREGKLTRPQRDKLLKAMTGEVAAKVLVHNYDQTLALSLMEAEAPADLDAHAHFMADLEEAGKLDRKVEGLPDVRTIAARAGARQGLTRPELAVLLAYGKLTLTEDVVASDGPDDPYFFETLKHYFPDQLFRYGEEMRQHRLRREIIATVLSNEIVDRCGPTFPARLRAGAGCDTSALVKAYEAARAILDLDALWDEVEREDGASPAAGQIALFRELVYVHRGQTFWLARGLAKNPTDVKTLVDRYRPAVHALRALGLDIHSDIEQAAAEARVQRYVEAGAPKSLAIKVAAMRPLTIAADLVDLASARDWPIEAVARVYHQAGGAFGFDEVRAGAASLAAGDAFERTAVRRLVEDLLAEQTELTAHLLDAAGGEAAEACRHFEKRHGPAIETVRRTLADIRQAGPWTFAKLTIANSALRGLAED